MADRFLNHFAVLAFEPDFHRLSPEGRSQALDALQAATVGLAEAVHIHAVAPARADADLILWSAVPVQGEDAAADFFARFNKALAPLRAFVRPVNMLWGFTRPSQYHPGKSPQVLDPMEPARKRYLVVYPFSKTAEWYMKGQEARQGMMNEHIRVGKEFPDVTQLLLYCTGLADQEFVVVYETDDLPRFSELVTALRSTDGRPYTLRDTPIYTAVWRPLPDTLDQWR